jgi:hypothetical protein
VENAEGLFEGAEGEQSGVGDDAFAVEVEDHGLRTDESQAKLRGRSCDQDLEPP